MRDHDLKNDIGKAEDEVDGLLRSTRDYANDARSNNATAHAEFYDNVVASLEAAKGELVKAYSYVLNGDEELDIEPLDDE